MTSTAVCSKKKKRKKKEKGKITRYSIKFKGGEEKKNKRRKLV